ncbi:hypothetical protein [Streptomyces sp. NPDC055709]
MAVIQSRDNDAEDPLETFARFLKRQAQEAGLGARDINARFKEEAAREAQRVASGQGSQPEQPISGMSFSKKLLSFRA